MVQKEVHRSPVLSSQKKGKTKDAMLFCLQSNVVFVSGGGREAFPCSGNGNGQSWNNRGSNGNYWSASLNSQTNGRNLNFNSGGVNPQNNNNRFNGFAVRPVQHSTEIILSITMYDTDKGKTSSGLVCSILRCTQAQIHALLCETLGRQSQREYGYAMRRFTESQIQAFAFEVLHRGLSEEERNLRSDLSRQSSTSSVLQLYSRNIREDIHSGLVQLHQGTWNALWHREAGAILQERISELAKAMLCHALGYSWLLHAYSQKEASRNSYLFSEEDVNSQDQQRLREDMERYSGLRLDYMADGSDCHARSEGELCDRRQRRRLDRLGSCQVHEIPCRRIRLTDRQFDFSAILECLSESLGSVHQKGSEMSLLRQICGRWNNSEPRQRLLNLTCSKDKAIPKRRAWLGVTHGKAADQRGTRRSRVLRSLHQTLENVYLTQDLGANNKEARPTRLYKADESSEIREQLLGYLPTYCLVQNTSRPVYERRISQNRCLRQRYDKDNRQASI